jgi:hypothetical protein
MTSRCGAAVGGNGAGRVGPVWSEAYRPGAERKALDPSSASRLRRLHQQRAAQSASTIRMSPGSK